jgi:hypothetical protein
MVATLPSVVGIHFGIASERSFSIRLVRRGFRVPPMSLRA